MIVQVLDHITDEIKQIRIDVFMKEQGFEDEFDEIDDIAKFVLLSIDGKAAGTCRYFPSDVAGDAHIGRTAFAVTDLKPAPCRLKYRQNHSTNPLGIKLKERNTLMKDAHIS